MVALPGDAHRAATASTSHAAPHAATVASPAVRALAREHGIDLSTVTGTGPGNRILKGDVLAALETTRQASTHTFPNAVPATPRENAPAVGREATVVPLRGFRRAMVAAMEASNAVPHFHLCDEVDMTQLLGVRQRLRGDALLGGQRLTFLPFVIKVCGSVQTATGVPHAMAGAV